MFGLSVANVHSVVSKMIINEELQASHDQPTSTIVIHKAEASPLQTLALNVSVFAKIMKNKTGNPNQCV